MPNIESFPDSELMDLMHLFAHVDIRAWDPNAAGSQKLKRSWFADAEIFRQKQEVYERVLRYTYYAIYLSVDSRLVACQGQGMAKILVDSTWKDQPFLLGRVVNLVVNVQACDEAEWSAIQEAIGGHINMMPGLKRLALRVCGDGGDGNVEEMIRFLVFRLRDLFKTRSFQVEVNCLIGPPPAPEKWCGCVEQCVEKSEAKNLILVRPRLLLHRGDCRRAAVPSKFRQSGILSEWSLVR